jgi:hypothetical protein
MMRDSFDQKQLEEAKSLDQVSYTDDYLGEKAAADSWELSLHSFLRQEGIPFQTEDEMRAKGELEITRTVFISSSISLLLISTSANTSFLPFSCVRLHQHPRCGILCGERREDQLSVCEVDGLQELLRQRNRPIVLQETCEADPKIQCGVRRDRRSSVQTRLLGRSGK